VPLVVDVIPLHVGTTHEDTKNGEDVEAVTEPPYEHVQPEGTLVPTLLAGQATGEHELEKKGEEEVAVTLPL